MKYNGENFAGTLIATLILEKKTEVSLDEILKAANAFAEKESKSDRKFKLVVTEKDVKKVCKRKKNVLKYDKSAKKVIFLSNSIDAYYHLHWGYEAMSLRLYGVDFSEKVLAAYKA